MSTTAKKRTLERALPWMLAIIGIIGILMSFILSYEHDQLLKNPNYIPSCNLNPVIACGSVINSKQSQAFHFPNPYIGLVGFAIILTTGVVLLAGAQLKRWYWLGLEAGTIFGIGFIHWLMFESVYRIHALCPYCMVVWVITITAFWYVTLYNLQQKYIVLLKPLEKIGVFAQKYHLDILIVWLLIIAGLVLHHFWYYYGKYF